VLAAAVLLAATCGALDVGAQERVARPDRAPVFEDGIPPPPSLAERLAEIRRRVQAAVVYPEVARRRGIEGLARIRFVVGSDGRAAQVETVESSGSALLDRAAEQGARDAHALPYVYGRVEMPVRFALERDGRPRAASPGGGSR
jgi:TonB family protein